MEIRISFRFFNLLKTRVIPLPEHTKTRNFSRQITNLPFQIQSFNDFFFQFEKFCTFSEFDDSEAIVEESIDSNSQSGYDIVVHRLVDHSDLPPETVFGCVLTIPGTSYEIREESIYRHYSGRK